MPGEAHVGGKAGAGSGLASPRRFFSTAPVAAGVAGAGITATGVDALQTGWDPLTLSLTHLCTLGFLSMAMFGGLIEQLAAKGLLTDTNGGIALTDKGILLLDSIAAEFVERL